MDLLFWKDKKVLITGHTGFKGAWLSFLLYKIGADVSGISLEPKYKENLYDSLTLNNIVKSYIHDIRNIENLKSTINKIQPEIIFHLAAQPLVRESYTNPLLTFETNYIGSANLLEVARNLKSLKSIVMITTDKVYKNKETIIPYNENSELGGYDPYSASKASCELLVSSYRNSYFKDRIGLATARAGNVIGGGDWSIDRILPDAIRSYHGKEKLKIRNPNSIRPWQHVLDSLCGYLYLANAINDDISLSGAYNFGPKIGDTKSVVELIQIVKKELGNFDFTEEKESSELHETNLLNLDNNKSQKNLGFVPKWNSNTAIMKSVRWYKNYYNSKNATELCANDIEDYFKDKDNNE